MQTQASLGYNLSSRRCTLDGPEYAVLSPDDRTRLMRAEERLQSYA